MKPSISSRPVVLYRDILRLARQFDYTSVNASAEAQVNVGGVRSGKTLGTHIRQEAHRRFREPTDNLESSLKFADAERKSLQHLCNDGFLAKVMKAP